MTPIEEIKFSDIAEELATKYGLSSVLIIAVERTQKHTKMSYGFDGSAFELSGASARFCRIITADVEQNLETDNEED